MSKIKVEQFVAKIDELTPTENNPRQISKQDFENLKKSMKEFPEMREIRKVVVDENNRILGGHMRIKALKELGESEVPVDKVHGLTEKQKERFVIQDNIQNGEWDMDELANSWSELPLDDWGIGVEWDTSEQEVVEDEAPEIDDSEPADSELGVVYQLGRHRLMCGDSTDAGSVAILMDGQEADMVFTDPPYELETEGGGVLKNSNSMVQVKANAVNHFEPSRLRLWAKTNIFFHNKPLIKEYIELAETNKKPYDLAIYKKQGLPNYKGHLMTDIEYIAIIGDQNPNQGLDFGLYSKVFEGKKDADNELSYSKPISLCSKFIQLYSSKTVLDLFGGSGSTLIACEQLGRKCYMMELDPKYCDVIRKRYWKFKTGSEEGWQEGTKEAE